MLSTRGIISASRVEKLRTTSVERVLNLPGIALDVTSLETTAERFTARGAEATPNAGIKRTTFYRSKNLLRGLLQKALSGVVGISNICLSRSFTPHLLLRAGLGVKSALEATLRNTTLSFKKIESASIAVSLLRLLKSAYVQLVRLKLGTDTIRMESVTDQSVEKEKGSLSFKHSTPMVALSVHAAEKLFSNFLLSTMLIMMAQSIDALLRRSTVMWWRCIGGSRTTATHPGSKCYAGTAIVPKRILVSALMKLSAA